MEVYIMYRNVLTIAKVTICNIALAGLLTGCGTMVDLELDTPARGNEVVESKESKEEETEETKEIEETTESEATFKTEVVEPTSEIELTTETNVVEESKEELTTEATTESSGFKVVVDSTSGVNAGYIVSDEKEYEQTYIAYEDMETVTMYVIAYSDMYADFNATEGAFRIEGYVYEGDEFNIDGKGAYEGVEYYRVVRTENSFNPYHLIIPAEALSFEKPVQQETEDNFNKNPAINENGGFTIGSNETSNSNTSNSPVSEVQTVSIEDLVGKDVYASLSEEDKKNLESIFNYDGQIAWAEDPNADIPGFSCERNENGGFTIIDPTLTPEQIEKIGNLIVY